MNPTYDAQGFLTKVEGSFGYGRSVSLTKWADSVFVHINDNSKCWDNKRFDKTKGKSVSLNWKNTEALADCLIQLRPFADQINAEQVNTFLNYVFAHFVISFDICKTELFQ